MWAGVALSLIGVWLIEWRYDSLNQKRSDELQRCLDSLRRSGAASLAMLLDYEQMREELNLYHEAKLLPALRMLAAQRTEPQPEPQPEPEPSRRSGAREPLSAEEIENLYDKVKAAY